MIEAYDLHMPNCFKPPKRAPTMSSISLRHMTKTEDVVVVEDPRLDQKQHPAQPATGLVEGCSEDDSDCALHPGQTGT